MTDDELNESMADPAAYAPPWEKPKFHGGDWVVANPGANYPPWVQGSTGQIIDVKYVADRRCSGFAYSVKFPPFGGREQFTTLFLREEVLVSAQSYTASDPVRRFIKIVVSELEKALTKLANKENS